MNDDFKVVVFGYCYEIDHMYKLRKTPSSQRKVFFAMVARTGDTSMLWH
jgi:hypothetical protein